MADFDDIAVEQEEPQDVEAPRPIVYVRSVKAAELPSPVAEQLARSGGLPSDDATLYAVHDEGGRPLGFFTSRDMAFVTARQQNAAPVSAH